MLRNYLKIALRNLLNHKIYTFINILGLSLGMTAAILLYLYIEDERSYDRHYKNAADIYRTISIFEQKNEGKTYQIATSSILLAETLKKDYPEVLQTTRFFKGSDKKPVTYKEKRLYANGMMYADASVFEVFNYTFIQGNPKTALKNPNSIVLTRSLAEKIFGSVREAMHKRLILFDTQNNLVTGVIEDIQHNSHLKFPALISLATVLNNDKFKDKSWANANFYTYILLKKNTNYRVFEDKLSELFAKYMAGDFRNFQAELKIKLQALTDIHLSSHKYEANERFETTDVNYIYIFSAIALFVLLIACVNYMNLATARSAGRAKEVGVRKVLGAYRNQLIYQFLLESFLLSVFSLLLSLCLAEFLLPFLNQFLGKELSIDFLQNSKMLYFLLLITLLVGLLSGSYPAFFLSRFHPVLVLKGKQKFGKSELFFRRSLVVFQFVISIVLIIGTWIIYEQLNYLREKHLGFDKEHILVMEVFNKETFTKIPELKAELLKNPQIKSVATSSVVPGSKEIFSNAFRIETENQMKEQVLQNIAIDYDFLDMMGLQLVSGRNFSPQLPSDTLKSVLINESLARRFGWRIGSKSQSLNPLGKKIEMNFDSLNRATYSVKVIGIVKNFHLTSLHDPIEPLVIFLHPKGGANLLVRISPDNISQSLKHIENTWNKFDKKFPYEAYFLDKNFAKQYEADEKMGLIFMYFSILTIFIACLGLFGLASFTAEQRTKEIGIRKVLGASVSNILAQISKEFIALVLIANLLAFPIAYFAMKKWLEDFAYHTEINITVFILSGFLALCIALATIFTQIYKAANVNPVNVLKNE